MVVAKAVPPDGKLYQTVFPALEVAFKVTLPASQRLFGVVDVIVGVEVIVAVTDVLADEHTPFNDST